MDNIEKTIRFVFEDKSESWCWYSDEACALRDRLVRMVRALV